MAGSTLKKIRWQEWSAASKSTVKREGVILGVIGKPGSATLVVYCDDGYIREVPAKSIRPV